MVLLGVDGYSWVVVVVVLVFTVLVLVLCGGGAIEAPPPPFGTPRWRPQEWLVTYLVPSTM